jgi:hypothetical protein
MPLTIANKGDSMKILKSIVLLTQCALVTMAHAQTSRLDLDTNTIISINRLLMCPRELELAIADGSSIVSAYIEGGLARTDHYKFAHNAEVSSPDGREKFPVATETFEVVVHSDFSFDPDHKSPIICSIQKL